MARRSDGFEQRGDQGLDAGFFAALGQFSRNLGDPLTNETMPSGPSIAQQQANQNTCIGISTAFTIISFIILTLRIYTRVFIVGKFGKDDTVMLGGLLFTIGYLITLFVLRQNGMGFSVATLSLDQITSAMKASLAIQVLYYMAVYCIKVSILSFYLRIAVVDKRFETLCKYTVYLLTVFLVICIVVIFAHCIPLEKYWDVTGQVPGRCIDFAAFYYSASGFNILTDVWILVLPIKTLRSIQRPNREKLALLFVFGLGVFSTISSIVRLYSIRTYTTSSDPWYDAVAINTWSMIEINIAIWCASIPALKALVIRSQRERSRATGYKYHSRDRTGIRVTNVVSIERSSEQGPGTQHEPEEFGLQAIVDVKQPRQMERKASNIDSDRSGSQERIYLPAADQGV